MPMTVAAFIGSPKARMPVRAATTGSRLAMMEAFPGSTRLLELAHTIEEMKTICTCGRKATCNCRKVNGVFVFEGEQVAIDLENDVQYVSMCPQCYFRERRAFYARRAAK